MENQPQVSSINENDVMRSYESDFMQALSKYVKNGLSEEELREFFNQLSQYHSLTVGVPLSEAVGVSFHDFKEEISTTQNLSS